MAAASGPRARALPTRLRRLLFWTHLGAGCVAGLVIVVLAVTGVLLTYERQILGALDRSAWGEVPAQASPRSLSSLLAGVAAPDFDPESVLLRAHAAAPIRIAAVGGQRLEVDRYSGAVLAPTAPGVRAVFDWVTGMHRWFALDGEARDKARAVTGAANLLFLWLALTGLVLWWPRPATPAAWRLRLASRSDYATTKARDYAWHHLLGFRFALPIIAITLTAPVFNYDWARNLLKTFTGVAPEAQVESRAPWAGPDAGVDAWLASARAEAGDWHTLLLELPSDDAATVRVLVDRGNGAQVQHQDLLLLARDTAAVVSLAPRYEDAPYRYGRMVVRFLHTGELFGWLGQTIAGLASLVATVLVWTGLSLAFRRLVLQPWRQRRARAGRRAAGTVA